MEPENTSLEKDNHLQTTNHQFLDSMLVFGVVSVWYILFWDVLWHVSCQQMGVVPLCFLPSPPTCEAEQAKSH